MEAQISFKFIKKSAAKYVSKSLDFGEEESEEIV